MTAKRYDNSSAGYQAGVRHGLELGLLAHLLTEPVTPTSVADELGELLSSDLGIESNGMAVDRLVDLLKDCTDISSVTQLESTLFRCREVVVTATSATGRAMNWLQDIMVPGGEPVLVKDLKQEAEAEGHSWRSVEQAKADLGNINALHPDAKGPWYWQMTDDAD